MEQLRIQDAIREGEAARDEGIARADQHARPDWKALAFECVRNTAAVYDEFTTDDVWQCLSYLPDVDTHEHRAMGGVMLRAARAGLIERTDRVRPTIRPEGHRGPKTVWRSKLRRRCPGCGASCRWVEDAWFCDQCRDEWPP